MFQLIIVPLLLSLIGLAIKYYPPLEKIKNNLIVWINTLLAILLKITVPADAQAGTWDSLQTIAASLGWLLPLIQTALARLVYETWGRPSLDLAGVKSAEEELDDSQFEGNDK